MTTEQRPRHLLHAFSTFQLGGPQARFVELANALGPMFRHTVVAMDNRFDAGERLHPSVNWAPMTLKVIKGGALANRASFRQVLRSLQPDLLMSYNWGAIEWAAANLPRFATRYMWRTVLALKRPHVSCPGGYGCAVHCLAGQGFPWWSSRASWSALPCRNGGCLSTVFTSLPTA